MKGLLTGVVVGVLALGMVQVASADLVNGSFEDPQISGPHNELFTDPSSASIDGYRSFAGWHTTASDHFIEVWHDGFQAGNPSLHPYNDGGNQFAELNANEASTLYQDISGISNGSIVGYQFAHRGRDGVDVMQFTITDLGSDGVTGGSGLAADSTLFTQQYSDGNSAWGFYQGSGIIASGNTMRFSYAAISAAGGNPTMGNFLDAAAFGVGVGVVPEPSTYALLCISLGVVGFARKKMRKSEA